MPLRSDAVDNASRLDEIGFPGSTSELIEATFDAIVTSMIRQQEASEFDQEAKIDREITE